MVLPVYEGVIMRRHEGGAGCGTRGRGSQLHPRGGPRSNPAGYYRAATGPGPVKRESGKMSRGAPTGVGIFFFRACSARPSLVSREEKETGPPPPE